MRSLEWDGRAWWRCEEPQMPGELKYENRYEISVACQEFDDMYFPNDTELDWLEGKANAKINLQFEAEYLGNQDGHTWRIWAILPSLGRIDLGIEVLDSGEDAIEYHLEHMANEYAEKSER